MDNTSPRHPDPQQVDEAIAATGGDREQRWLTPGVAGVGAASFCSDAGHEIATSVLPGFLTVTLHAAPSALGVVEGISDALVGVSKLAGGPLAADPARRGRLASSGYLGTALATSAIGLATSVWQVGVLRALAWASRGVRSPARDSLLVSLVPERAYGRAAGLERAGDNAGAVVGPLLASGLVAWVGIRNTFFFALVPGLLAAVAITFAAREARRRLRAPTARRRLSFHLRRLHAAGLTRALVPAGLFEFGNMATTMLILRATDLLTGPGRSVTAATSVAILLYAGHNVAATVGAATGGHLIDRVGPRPVFGAAAAVYVGAYVLFAVDVHAWPVLLVGFAAAGVGIGFAETAETTLVARLLPDELRGNGFGVLGLLQALGDLASTAMVGILWTAVAPGVGFLYAAGWMLAAMVATLRSRSRLMATPAGADRPAAAGG